MLSMKEGYVKFNFDIKEKEPVEESKITELNSIPFKVFVTL